MFVHVFLTVCGQEFMLKHIKDDQAPHNMASFRSKYAYPLMYYMLSHKSFTQRSMARALGYQHGGSIHNFVTWLQQLGYVARSRNLVDKTHQYYVSSPPSLVKFFSNFRHMRDLRLQIDVGEDRSKVLEYLKKKDSVFCLTTALE